MANLFIETTFPRAKILFRTSHKNY